MKAASVRVLRPKDSRGFTYAEVDIDSLIPDSENPRIPIQESSLDTILALQGEDPNGLFSLAKDIVKMGGTNPAELLNVEPLGNSFVVKEGNRRVAARRLLRNPEQLRGHVSDKEVARWSRLSKDENARKLPTAALVVIGDDHEAWVDRRHLGPQSGVGVIQWNPQAKARREERRRGVKDRTLSFLDSLKASYPKRFADLDPPKRTFTTFERVLDSQSARAHLGIDVDEGGRIVLSQGERSLRLIEEILRDLRKEGEEKLTSRTIHSAPDILNYLGKLDSRIGSVPADLPITLSAASTAAPSGKSGGTRRRSKAPDVLKSFVPPAARRPRKIFDELTKARRKDMPNAAMILTRVLLELSVDDYASRHTLPFAGDKNAAAEIAIAEFRKNLGSAGIQIPKTVKEALRLAATRPVSLGEKLDMVIADLIDKKVLVHKEGQAKRRELAAKDVVHLLNDAVHRLEVVPSVTRVDHVLEVVAPVFNAMGRS